MTTSARSEARIPSLLSIFSVEMPSVSIGRRKAVIPRWRSPGLVFAMTTPMSATVPLVIHILFPFRMYSSPSFSATVSIPETFDP